jgi:hypothetical protein
MQAARHEVPLPLAAQRLRISGERARRMILRGELDGRLEGGRWVVTRESLREAELRLGRSESGASPCSEA